ncbi:hypothetical protein [Streptomyces scabiei]|uniref:hypothetical protein n=1 Tax=Streptomyces scabiei TaxID=1930 RepID=UPI001B303221|nr:MULTISPECIES: hypothetical protein [unclassified Streptomyces]
MKVIATACFLADVGQDIPTTLVPSLLTVTLGAATSRPFARCSNIATPFKL